MIEIRVDRAGEDDVAEARAVGDLVVVDAEDALDARMGRHPFDHRGVAAGRHHLEAVAEIAVVGVGAGRNAAADAGVELVGIAAPMLARVAREEALVEFAADARDDHVLRGPDLGARLGRPVEKRRHAGLVEVEAVERVDRGRLIGIGSSRPSTFASTRCSKGRQAVKALR